MSDSTPEHFKGKDALEHVIEAQAQGIIDSAEIHGAEIPGHISAAADAARETALTLMLIWTIFLPFALPIQQKLLILGAFALGWLIWKAGRSAWLAWSRLERLHRIVAEEKWEIEHHRQQERDELRELYRAKGFDGKLLEDVLDVLMADGDRLLRVMVEEELGLSLEIYEHPLKQCLGATLGSIMSIIACLIGALIYLPFGIIISALIVIGCAGALSAHYQKNKIIPAIVWNVGLSIAAVASVYFLLPYIPSSV